MLKLLSVVGARPNFVKIAPLMRAMAALPQINSVLIHTGQHYDERLSDIFFRQMAIPAPDENLGAGSGSHAQQTAEVLRRMEPVLLRHQPDAIVVVGDVNSTLAAALCAVKLGIPVAHVEAGLRSFDRTMPEEINRVATDAIADLLFASERAGVENLLREGRRSEDIFFVGNVMIDALRQFLPAAGQSPMMRQLGLDGRQFALITLHRPSNVDDARLLHQLLAAAARAVSPLPLVFPVHPRTRDRMSARPAIQNLRLTEPIGYTDFLALMSHARLVFTDSGGIQEETTALGIPCLTLRDNTERPVTITQGTNRLVGQDPGRITAAAAESLRYAPGERPAPELWDGHAAERIVSILVERVVPESMRYPRGTG